MHASELARVAVTLLAAGAVGFGALARDGRSESWTVSVAAAQTHEPQDHEQAANTLFVEALQQIEAAGRATRTSVRLDLLRQAQANLDRIVQDHPGSQLAVQLITGQRIGTFEPRVFRNTLAEAEDYQICAHASDACALFADALETARDVPMHALRSEALARIAVLQADAGLTHQARQSLAESLTAVRQTPEFRQGWKFAEALTAVASAQAALTYIDDARHTFADALTATDELSSRQERGAVFLMIAVAQAQAGLFDDALTTVGQIGSRNCRFRARAIAAIGSHLAQAGLIEDARRTMEQAVAAGQVPQCREGAYRVEPPLAIAAAQATAGFVEEAQISFADALTRSRTDGFLETGRVGALADIAGTQMAAGFGEDAERTLAEALTVVADGSATPVYVESLADLAAVQAAFGLSEEALVTAGEIDSEGHRTLALLAIAAQLQALGFADEAQQIFTDAAVAAASTEGLDHRTDMLARVAIAQAEAGLLNHASATAGEMPSEGLPLLRVDALAKIGAAQAVGANMAEAQRVFAAALAAVNDMRPSDEVSRSMALLLIAKAQARAASAILSAE